MKRQNDSVTHRGFITLRPTICERIFFFPLQNCIKTGGLAKMYIHYEKFNFIHLHGFKRDVSFKIRLPRKSVFFKTVGTLLLQFFLFFIIRLF